MRVPPLTRWERGAAEQSGNGRHFKTTKGRRSSALFSSATVIVDTASAVAAAAAATTATVVLFTLVVVYVYINCFKPFLPLPFAQFILVKVFVQLAVLGRSPDTCIHPSAGRSSGMQSREHVSQPFVFVRPAVQLFTALPSSGDRREFHQDVIRHKRWR